MSAFRKVFGEVEEVEPYRSLRFLNLPPMSRGQWVIEESIIDKSKQKV